MLKLFISILSISWIFSCSETGGGNLGYGSLSSDGSSQEGNTQAPFSPAPAPAGNQSFDANPGNSLDTDPGFGNSGTDDGGNSVDNTPKEPPKPVGTKSYDYKAIESLFDDHEELELTSFDNDGTSVTAINGISDDEDTAKNICQSLRYDKFKVVSGGISYENAAEKYLAKWDSTDSEFKIQPAASAGNSRMFKLECSND